MSEGELAAVFRGLAEDAGEAGGQIADSIAKFTDDTANIEDANVARTLTADADTARAANAIGKDAGSPEAGQSGIASADTGSQGTAAGPAQAGERYSGALRQVNKPDPDADALAERINGLPRVKFENDPQGREFDTVSDEYIGQAKPARFQISKAFRAQARATFQAAGETGRGVYYHFDGPPLRGVIEKLEQYSAEYHVRLVIDTEPFR